MSSRREQARRPAGRETGCRAEVVQLAHRSERSTTCMPESTRWFVCETHDPTGEPGAGKPHARFDERRLETEPWRGLRHRHRESAGNSDSPRPTATAPVVDSTRMILLEGKIGDFSLLDADPCVVTGRTPSSRFDVVSATPSATFGPCGQPPRRLDAHIRKVRRTFRITSHIEQLAELFDYATKVGESGDSMRLRIIRDFNFLKNK